MNPYKKNKTGGRIASGDPNSAVVKTDTGVPLSVKATQTQMGGDAGQIQKGKNSSYGVSSGLVNMLDVVNGVSNVMQKADKLGNQIDDHRMGEMNKRIAALQKEDKWIDPEHPDYVKDEDKYAQVAAIQDEYKSGWLNDKYRTQYDGAVSHNKMGLQKLGFNHDLATASAERDRMIATGSSFAEAQKAADDLYNIAVQKHGGNDIQKHAIEQAQRADAAKWGQGVTMGVTAATTAWEASGGPQTLAHSLPTGVGYDQWRQSAMAEMASQGGPGTETLWDSYDDQKGVFTGPYADMFQRQVDEKLQPYYNQAVAMQVGETRLQAQTHAANAPRVAITEIGPVLTNDMPLAVSRGSTNLNGLIDVVTQAGGQSPGQHEIATQSYMDNMVTGLFQTNGLLTNQQAGELVMGTLDSSSRELATFWGLEEDSPQFQDKLDAMKKTTMSTFKLLVDKTNARNTKTADLGQHAPTNNTQQLAKQHGQNPVTMISKANRPVTIGLSSGTGQRLAGGDAVGMGLIIQDVVTSGAFSAGRDPKETQKSQLEINKLYAAFLADPKATPDLLMLKITEAIDGSPYKVALDGRGDISISWDPEVGGDPVAQSRAQIGTMLPYLQFDPKKGVYSPQGTIQSTPLKGLLESSIRSTARGTQGRVSPAFLEEVYTVMDTAGSFLGPDSEEANIFVTDLLYEGLTSDFKDGISAEKASWLRGALGRAVESGDQDKIAGIASDVLAQRWNAIAIKTDAGWAEATNISPEVRTMIGASATVGVDQVESSGWNPLSGDFYGDGIVGQADSVVAEIGGLVKGDRAEQAFLKAGIKSGAFQVDSHGMITEDATDDRTGAEKAAQMREQLRKDGYDISYSYSPEGDIVGIGVTNVARVYKLNKEGEFVESQSDGFDTYSKPGFAESMESGTTVGDETKGTEGKLGDDGNTFARGNMLAKRTRSQAIESGLNGKQADAWMRGTENRRNLAGWMIPARDMFMDGSDATLEERSVVANQIDETLKVYHDAGIEIGEENKVAARSIAARMRRGLSPGDPLWKEAQQMAKEAGFVDWAHNPPMWSVKSAIMATIFPEHRDNFANLSPYHVNADSGFQSMGDSGQTHTQQGYNARTRVSISSFQLPGRSSNGDLNLPLFIPAQVENTTKGDPRTFIRGKNVNRANTSSAPYIDIHAMFKAKKALDAGNVGPSEDPTQVRPDDWD